MTDQLNTIVNCVIYKGNKKPDSYLYIEKADDFSRLPDILISLLGELELVMCLELSAQRKLVQADVVEVMEQLQTQGYYLQMPPNQQRPEIISDLL